MKLDIEYYEMAQIRENAHSCKDKLWKALSKRFIKGLSTKQIYDARKDFDTDMNKFREEGRCNSILKKIAKLEDGLAQVIKMGDPYAEKSNIQSKINTLKKQRSEMDKKIKKIEKAEEDRQKKLAEAFATKISNLLFDESFPKSEDYHDTHWGEDGDDRRMIDELTRDDYGEIGVTQLDYNWESIIDEAIENAEEFFNMEKRRLAGLKKFKERLKKLYGEQK